jgi:hypothetical protein
MGRVKGSKTARSLSEHVCLSENILQSVAFWFADIYTTLYFVNKRTYKTPAKGTRAVTRMRNFCSLNVIISHQTLKGRTRLFLCMCYCFAVSPSLLPTCMFLAVFQADSYFAFACTFVSAMKSRTMRWAGNSVLLSVGEMCCITYTTLTGNLQGDV